jgi:hypothetical protein
MKNILVATVILIAAGSIMGSCNTNPTSIVVQPKPPLTDLPADLAAVNFKTEGSPSAPYTVLELSQSGGFNGFVVVNGEGKPVWFFRTKAGTGGFTRRANGNFVFLDGGGGLIEVTVRGDTVRVLPQEAAPGRRIHHDVTATPQNTILFIAEDWQTWKDSLMNGAALWEWNPESGSLVKRWSSFDHLSPDLDWGSRSARTDWLHPNSMRFGPRGNIVLSLHYLNQVISITSDFKNLEWRLGGVRSTIPVSDPFSGQHSVQEIEPGHILLFDNGIERTVERYSRALELEIVGDSSRKVWQWRPPIDNWALVISSARRLPNGNTMVGFGLSKNPTIGSTGPIEAYEVTSSGQVVWHIVMSGAVSSMYRATPLYGF